MNLFCEVKLNWTTEQFKVLEILSTNYFEDMHIINFQKVLMDPISMLRVWSRRHLNLFVKISVAKSLCASKQTHFLMVISRPLNDVMQDIQEFFGFIWADKKDKIKRSLLPQSHEKGRIKMIDVFVYYQAVKPTFGLAG